MRIRIFLREKVNMHRLIVAVLIVLLASTSIAADIPTTEDQKTLYAIGLLVSRSLTAFNLTPAELEIVKQGLTDAGTGKTRPWILPHTTQRSRNWPSPGARPRERSWLP